MGWWLSVPRFGVSWFFRLHVEASAHGSSGPPVLPVGSLVLWSNWLIGCGHRIIRSIAAKKKKLRFQTFPNDVFQRFSTFSVVTFLHVL